LLRPADIQHSGLGRRGEHRKEAIHAPPAEADEHEKIEGLKGKFHLPIIDVSILDMPILEDSREGAQKNVEQERRYPRTGSRIVTGVSFDCWENPRNAAILEPVLAGGHLGSRTT
jgi:hypothetical protein